MADRGGRYLLALAACVTPASAASFACGDRTGLDVLLEGEVAQRSSRPAHVDAGLFDVAPHEDGPGDAGVAREATADSGLTCPDGGPPNAYLFDLAKALWQFDPTTLRARRLGVPRCGDTESPWTLSVTRDGQALLLYEDWRLFDVDLATLACRPLPFQVDQLGLDPHVAIAVSRSAGTEKLYIYGEVASTGAPILAESDLTSFVFHEVGEVLPVPPTGAFPLDMQGDPQGHLYGFAEDGVLLEIDSASGAVLQEAQAVMTTGTESWAVMSYEDRVYLFTDTQVATYDFATMTATPLGDIGVNVVGASAVSCLGAR